MIKKSKRESLIEAIEETKDLKVWEDIPSAEDNPKFAENIYLRKMANIPTTPDFSMLSETTKQDLFDWYKDNLKLILTNMNEPMR